MKTKFFAFAALAALMISPVAAADFSFEADLQGDGALEWEFDFNESEQWTDTSGAEFDFNGGAGTNGEAVSKGDFTGVGGIYAEYAYGTGDAYSNTLGGNYAEAEFHSGSGALTGGFAADLEFGDPAKVSFNGLAVAGGAGSAGSGLYTGTEYSYHQDGAGSYSVDANLGGSLEY